MIISFKCKETEKIWEGCRSRKISQNIQERALRKLRQLSAANSLDDLKMPPSNNLEILKGSRKGQYSIRINKQWRICFIWTKGQSYEVEIIDYH